MTFLITYDHSQVEISQESIHKFITEELNVSDWWHYLPDVYVVSSAITATNLSNSMVAKFPGMRFLIIKVATESGDFNGRLNQKAWEWLAKPKKILVKIRSSPPPIGLPTPTSQGLPPIKQSTGNALLDALSWGLPVKPQTKPMTLEEILKIVRK